MQVRRLSLFLSLCIALVIGVVPMRVCGPTDGCAGGVVAVGRHAHDGHDHDHGVPGDGGVPAAACVDAPFPIGLPASPVTLDAPSEGELLPVAIRQIVGEQSEIFESGRRVLDDGVPLGTRSVVLLR